MRETFICSKENREKKDDFLSQRELFYIAANIHDMTIINETPVALY